MDTKDKSQEVAEQKVETIVEKYWDAIEAKVIATKLIQESNFNFPTNTPILYVFLDKSKTFWAKCQLASALQQFASGYQYVIQFNNEAWQNLTDLQREALVFHELLHIFYDSEKDKYSLAKHDVEEFSLVIRKYGLWREDVKKFMDEGWKAITLDSKEPDEQLESKQ